MFFCHIMGPFPFFKDLLVSVLKSHFTSAFYTFHCACRASLKRARWRVPLLHRVVPLPCELLTTRAQGQTLIHWSCWQRHQIQRQHALWWNTFPSTVTLPQCLLSLWTHPLCPDIRPLKMTPPPWCPQEHWCLKPSTCHHRDTDWSRIQTGTNCKHKSVYA